MLHDEGNTPLHLAILDNQLERVEELLAEPEVDRNKTNLRGETPLFLSLKSNCNDDIVLSLIENGCNVNISNDKSVTPLHLAVQRRTNLIAFKLIEKGADIRAKDGRHGCTPLHRAVVQGRLHILQEFLKRFTSSSIEPDIFKQTLLMFSILKNCGDKIVSALIDWDDDINVRDNSGYTALHLAVERRTNVVARRLIERGANIDAETVEGYTPMHRAVLRGNVENLCLLLYYNASADVKDVNGRTPFHLAITNKEMALHLIDFNVDFDELDCEGFSSLHAALRENAEIALEVIERGADVNALWHETHCLLLSLWWHNSSVVFEAIWLRTDYDFLLGTFESVENVCRQSFLEVFVWHCKFPSDQFLRCLYLIFDSSHIQAFLEQYVAFDPRHSLIYNIVEREIQVEDRVEMLLVLLSQGVEVHFHDICCLYEKYGFDKSIEVLLLNGCPIQLSASDMMLVNPMVSKICYNTFDIYLDIADSFLSCEKAREFYDRYYKVHSRVSFYGADGKRCPVGVKSLLEMCRDVVRNVIYENHNCSHSFKIYQALSQLPVPPSVRDILFLKEPIY